jgi:GMP synthase (glutamine-hydrolysing)
MNQDTIVIIDLGSNENSTLARMIRSMGVYSEIQPHDVTERQLAALPKVRGVILSGGENRVVNGQAVMPSKALLDSGLPMLAIGCDDLPDIRRAVLDKDVIRTFVFADCGCKAEWNMDAFVKEQTRLLREQIGQEQVLLALSGGVDSSVVAALLIRAVGSQLTCIHVNHGLLRKDESEQVIRVFREQLGANLIYIDAIDRFLGKLAGVSDPEQKRKIIGAEFIRVFEEEAARLKGIRFLGQGTIYPDIVESGTKTAKVIKAHHKVGGLPDSYAFDLVEPIKYLYKDEVRVCGLALGLPEFMVYRQPLLGPGLGVCCLGAITRDRLEAVRESDAILREEFQKAGLEGKVWQYFTVVPDFRSVGIRDHACSFEFPVIIRTVHTADAITATVAHPEWAVLDQITRRIVHEVRGVNRVCYDLTPKPTGTIEWE